MIQFVLLVNFICNKNKGIHRVIIQQKKMILIKVSLVVLCACSLTSNAQTITQLQEEVGLARRQLNALARQMLLQQLRNEERVRNEGDSGVMLTRRIREGTRPYHNDHHTRTSYMFIHDHSDNRLVLGLGEFNAVLNGVEFRTRHNDYVMRKPGQGMGLGHREDMEPPDVPPEVTRLPTVKAQIEEMQKWFKAWQDQDRSQRDYTKYFKPALCYLEGAWYPDRNDIHEPFPSDRHQINAKNAYELREKMRYVAFTGSNDGNENLAFLPTSVWNITEDGHLSMATWGYTITCVPLKDDVPLNRFGVVDDLAVRMREFDTLEDYAKSRKARFILNSEDKPFTTDNNEYNTYLDSLMYQIPGKSNYKNWTLRDNGMDGTPARNLFDRTQILDSSRYHRAIYEYRNSKYARINRGYNDRNLYMAQNTQGSAAHMRLTLCDNGNLCRVLNQRWSYAIPLEIVYMTPLTKWNPYNIKHWQKDEAGFTQYNAGGKNGKTKAKAYDGVVDHAYYMTPYEFFEGTELNPDAADTTPSGGVWVKDQSGTPRLVRASGHRILMPNIPGINKTIRQRYPIAPVHAEGSTVWKELDALKEMVLNPGSYSHMYYTPPPTPGSGGSSGSNSNNQNNLIIKYRMSISGSHTHEITLNSDEMIKLQNGETLTKTTTFGNDHRHILELYAMNGVISDLRYSLCDGRMFCRDGHWRFLRPVPN